MIGENLNVRARPGVTAGNPSVARLQRYTVVNILESVTAADGVWYRIGTDQYVHSAHVGAVTPISRPKGVAADGKWIAVNLSDAKWLFDWSTPSVPEGERIATSGDLGLCVQHASRVCPLAVFHKPAPFSPSYLDTIHLRAVICLPVGYDLA